MIFLPRGGADKEEKGKDDKIIIPDEVSILPLRGTVLYPDLILPIMVGRKKSVKLIDDAWIPIVLLGSSLKRDLKLKILKKPIFIQWASQR